MADVDDNGSAAGAKQVERAVRVLLSIAQDGYGSVRDLAARLDIDRNAVHRGLVALSAVGLVTWSESTQQYRIGPAAVQLAAAYRQQADLVTAAIPHLTELQRLSSETAVLVTIVGDVRVPVYQVQSDQPLRYVAEMGQPKALHRGAAGLAILAAMRPALVEKVLQRTSVPSTVAKRTIRRVNQARAQGWTTSERETSPEVAAVAAPIAGPGGQYASVVVCGPVGRLHGAALERLGPPVKSAAERIAEELGAL